MSKNANAKMVDLTDVPVIAWPTVVLFIGCIQSFVITTFFAVSGNLNWWYAGLSNGIFLYFLFAPMHDALHGTVSANLILNETIGRISFGGFYPSSAYGDCSVDSS